MNQSSGRKGAFTLVEMLVAIAVLSILLAVVFVPLRLAIDSYHIGSARTTTQNAAQATLDDMGRDFARAIYVFPNTAMAGITDKAPYTSNKINNSDTLGYPYTKSTDPTDTGTSQEGVCPVGPQGVKAKPFGNTSRVEMILGKRDAVTGAITLPPQADATVVCYYARRQNINLPYSPVDNPLVLFRVQFPYGSVLAPSPAPPGAFNADISSGRFPSNCTPSSTPVLNRQALWLEHNAYGEANLESLGTDPSLAQQYGASHTVAIPRGTGLVASQAYKVDPSNANYNPSTINFNTEAPLVPDLSFQLADTNGDGKINRITVSLALETFDVNQGASTSTNGQPTGQIVRTPRVFDLPNVR